jgi:predicted ester cyclase
MTPAERADVYRACWDKFNAKAWDDFKKCYGDTAEVDAGDGRPRKGADAIIEETKKGAAPFPDLHGDVRLVLVNGTNIAGVVLVTGTNTQPLTNPDGTTVPATNKKIGQLFAHVLQTTDAGRVTKEYEYFESGTMAAQLGLAKTPARKAMAGDTTPPTVVIATNSPTETANVAFERKGIEDWNAHNVKAVEEAFAADVVWREAALPGDTDRKGLMTSLKEFWAGFSNIKISVDDIWAAGDYAVVRGTVEGVNDGPLPSMGFKKKTGKNVKLAFVEIDRIEGGKIKEAWLFYDGAVVARQLSATTTP